MSFCSHWARLCEMQPGFGLGTAFSVPVWSPVVFFPAWSDGEIQLYGHKE